MFRNHPIFRGSPIGMAGAEDHQLFALLAELHLRPPNVNQPASLSLASSNAAYLYI
jgi:hypothetical protein